MWLVLGNLIPGISQNKVSDFKAKPILITFFQLLLARLIKNTNYIWVKLYLNLLFFIITSLTF
jgi:hypothetical protein